MLYGQIIKWNPQKKYGFIAPEGKGPDIFFHISSVVGSTPQWQPAIDLGRPVKYELVPGTEPKPIRRGPLSLDERLSGPPAPQPAPEAKVVELLDKMPGAIIEALGDVARVAHHPNARKKKPNWRR